MTQERSRFLLINNNNTRTKFALASDDGLIAHQSIATADVSTTSVASLLEKWEYEDVILASVVPSSVPALKEAHSGKRLIEVSHRIPLGVEIDFPDPSGIGADRLGNAAAVAGQFPGQSVIVVDF